MQNVLNALFACHRMPERSFFFRNVQFPICARCTGILVGYILGLIYALIFGELSVFIIIVLFLPLIIDGGFQYLGKWVSTNNRRFITGILAGVATDFLIYKIISIGFNNGRQLMQFFST